MRGATPKYRFGLYGPHSRLSLEARSIFWTNSLLPSVSPSDCAWAAEGLSRRRTEATRKAERKAVRRVVDRREEDAAAVDGGLKGRIVAVSKQLVGVVSSLGLLLLSGAEREAGERPNRWKA